MRAAPMRIRFVDQWAAIRRRGQPKRHRHPDRFARRLQQAAHERPSHGSPDPQSRSRSGCACAGQGDAKKASTMSRLTSATVAGFQRGE